MSHPGTVSSPPAVPADLLSERLERLRSRVVAAGGDPTALTIVAVTKGFGPQAAQAAVDAGLKDLGENYARELIEKAGHGVVARWHFLGSVQRNKVARLAPLVSLWQTIDRPVAADAVAARQAHAAVLLEVNLTGDPRRPGCAAGEASDLLKHCRRCRLDVQGLMGVAPAGDPVASRKSFRTLAGLRRALELKELSMGMSDDFEAAVSEGSTMIRIGRLLFGPRPGSPRARR